VIETLSPETAGITCTQRRRRRPLIATYLDGAGYRSYRASEAGSLLVLFAARDLEDVGTQVHLEADDDVLSVRVVTDRLFPPEQRARLEAVCNEWHQEYRWPMVYLRPRPNGLLAVICEGHLNTAGAGIHQALVDRFCSVLVNCSHDLWDWLLRQDLEGLPPDAADLDDDLGALLEGN